MSYELPPGPPLDPWTDGHQEHASTRRVLTTMLSVIIAMVLFGVLSLGGAWYFFMHHRSTIDSTTHGEYRAEFVKIGNTAFLGSTDVQVIVFRNGEPINTLDSRITTSNEPISSANWDPQFAESHLRVVITGPTQNGTYCLLYYDGHQECD